MKPKFITCLLIPVLTLLFVAEAYAEESNGTSKAEFKGKSFAGYQAWYRAGNNAGDWKHWSNGWIPAPGLQKNDGVLVSSWPDVSEYAEAALYQTNFANLGNGSSAKLYSVDDSLVIAQQFNKIQETGLSGVALQRPVGSIDNTVNETDSLILSTIKNEAERTDRLFYICYDLTGAGSDILEKLENDWVYGIEQAGALTSSSNYAVVEGKPVVEIKRVGYDLGIDADKMKAIISFFKSRGCYVIGGTPRDWRTAKDGISLTGYMSVYDSLDCISPLTKGAYSDANGANNYYNNYMIDDYAYCQQNGIDYVPVCVAGSSNQLTEDLRFYETDRLGGSLLWTQVNNAKKTGCNAVYFDGLDNFDDGSQLLGTAVDYFDLPTDEYFETLAKDGVWTSSDYYLRLAAEAEKQLRENAQITTDIPVPHSLGPIYFRNSFESRTTEFSSQEHGQSLVKTMKIDPCYYQDGLVSFSKVSSIEFGLVKNSLYANSGEYTSWARGYSAENSSVFSYKTNATNITVKGGMQLSYYKYAVNELGKNCNIDLLFSDGTRLSYYDVYVPESGEVGVIEKTEITFGVGDIVGKTITGIAMRYANGETGYFEAYFDDIIISGDTSNYGYAIEYYYDNVLDDALTITDSAKIGATITYTPYPREGYKLDSTAPASGELMIGSDSASNILKVYYGKETYGYTVEYYYDEEIDNDKTETDEALFGETVVYTDKVIDGYILDRTDPANGEITISATAAENIIRVYYIGNNADLSALSVSEGSLTPAFHKDSLSYAVEVAYEVNVLTINATAAHDSASITGTGEKSLSVGSNPFDIIVTAKNGNTKTYTVTVTRSTYIPSNNANLATLSVSEGVLSPAFHKDSLTYTVKVAYEVNSITLSAAAAHDSASVQGTGEKSLSVGSNPFNVVVTAESDSTKTYIVTVVRAAYVPSSNADLATLSVSSGTLAPAFNKDSLSYTVEVAYEVNSIIISAKAAHDSASVAGTGEHPLAVGYNSFVIRVTAEADSITKDYTVAITRKGNPNADLASLSVSSGTLTPAFHKDSLTYRVEVAYEIDSIVLSAAAEASGATVEGIGKKALDVGENLSLILVFAEDTTVRKAYAVTIIRSADTKVSDEIAPAVKVYPNPVSKGGEIHVELPANATELSLYNASGRLMFRKILSGKQSIIMPSQTGIYILKVGEQFVKIVVN